MKCRILQLTYAITPSYSDVVQKVRAHTACCLCAFNILSYSNTCKEECPHVYIKPVCYSYGKMFQVPDMFTFRCLISPSSIHSDTDDVSLDDDTILITDSVCFLYCKLPW